MLTAELENGQQTPPGLQVWDWQQCSHRAWAYCESQERKEVLELRQGVDELCLLLAHPHGARASLGSCPPYSDTHLLGLSHACVQEE